MVLNGVIMTTILTPAVTVNKVVLPDAHNTLLPAEIVKPATLDTPFQVVPASSAQIIAMNAMRQVLPARNARPLLTMIIPLANACSVVAVANLALATAVAWSVKIDLHSLRTADVFLAVFLVAKNVSMTAP